jgi:hypothetical protein
LLTLRITQVELMGKGGPPSKEYDVRIVHAKVHGVDASKVALEGKTLMPKCQEFVATHPLLDHPPRLDSSDSETDDEEEDYVHDDYYSYDQFINECSNKGQFDEWEYQNYLDLL